jgi:hypothetical protein
MIPTDVSFKVEDKNSWVLSRMYITPNKKLKPGLVCFHNSYTTTAPLSSRVEEARSLALDRA